MAGGSGRGYHFISEWQVCPRKWFLKNVAGLQSNEPKAAASMGTVLHWLQERFYVGDFFNVDEPYFDEVNAKMEEFREAWFEDEDFAESTRKVGAAFAAWRRVYGMGDLANWDIVGVEVPLTAALPNGNVVTGLIDTLFRDKATDELIFKDTKTTSWAPESAHKKVEMGDQVTMYTWLIHKTYGDKPLKMIPDIIYLKPKMPTVHRFGEVRRTKREVENFIYGLCHVTDRMVTDLKSYEENEAPPEYLFPRSATVCSEFGCEFEDICRGSFDEATPPPMSGYSRTTPITSENLFKLLDKS